MQILIIDNNIDADSWGASEIREMAAQGAPGSTIHVRRAPQVDLPRDARAFDRVIVSGSKTGATEEAPWITRLEEFIRGAVRDGKPLFGICYGHQILARALGGVSTVREAPQGEFGWAEVELLDEAAGSPLFRGLPRAFHSFAWHKDEVVALPPGLRNLARSRDCAIQACQLQDRPVYGVQFHPERSLEAGERSLAKRAGEKPQARDFVNAGAGRKLFDAQVGKTLFRNFLSGAAS